MKKLKEIMAAAIAAAMVISVPVYASENDKFSDGGIAEQMEVFPAGELTGDALMTEQKLFLRCRMCPQKPLLLQKQNCLLISLCPKA